MTSRTRTEGNNETQSNELEASEDDSKTKGQNDVASPTEVTTKAAESTENITDPENTSLDMSENEGNVESDTVTNVATPNKAEDSGNEDTNFAGKDIGNLTLQGQEVAQPAKKTKKRRRSRKKSASVVPETDAADSAESENILQNADVQLSISARIAAIESGKIDLTIPEYVGKVKVKSPHTGKEEIREVLITKALRTKGKTTGNEKYVAVEYAKGKRIIASVNEEGTEANSDLALNTTKNKDASVKSSQKEHEVSDNIKSKRTPSLNCEIASPGGIFGKKGKSPKKSVRGTSEKEHKLHRATHCNKDADSQGTLLEIPVSAIKSEINELQSSYKVKQKINKEDKNADKSSTENQLNLSDKEIKTEVVIRPAIFVKDKYTQTDLIQEPSNNTIGTNATSSVSNFFLENPNQEHISKHTLTENNSVMKSDSDSTAKVEALVSSILIDPETAFLDKISEHIDVQDLVDSDLSSIDPVLQNIRDDFLRDFKNVNEQLKDGLIKCFKNEE